MLGAKDLISNIDVEVKRRKILALTPPPDVFLSNSNQDKHLLSFQRHSRSELKGRSIIFLLILVGR